MTLPHMKEISWERGLINALPIITTSAAVQMEELEIFPGWKVKDDSKYYICW